MATQFCMATANTATEQTDWSKCCICQCIKTEKLSCPGKKNHQYMQVDAQQLLQI